MALPLSTSQSATTWNIPALLVASLIGDGDRQMQGDVCPKELRGLRGRVGVKAHADILSMFSVFFFKRTEDRGFGLHCM